MSSDLFVCTNCETRPSLDGKPGMCDKCYFMSWDRYEDDNREENSDE